MPYYVTHRCEFDTVKTRLVKIEIHKEFTEAPTAPVINLIAATESPLEINYQNGEFDKMAPIRESKLRLRILNKNVNASDFFINYDTEYKILVYIAAENTLNYNLEWAGFLDNNIITEPLLDTYSTIEISANDGLSLLKTKDLVSSINDQIWNKISLKNLLAVVLYHTNLQLNFNTYINLYNDAPSNVRNDIGQMNDVFDYTFVYSHTFLRGPRDFDDCYAVLSKIMQSFGCTIFQARGEWFIIQTNDRALNQLDGTLRDFSGEPYDVDLNAQYNTLIGLNEETKLINADALTSVEKAYKEVSVKYKFTSPPIYFRNWDLVDGIFRANLSTNTRKIYELSHWEFGQSWTQVVPINGSKKGYVAADIVNTINGDVELRRYLVLYRNDGMGSAFNGESAVKTQRYPVNKGDIINVGFRARLNVALTPGTYTFYKCIVKLIGNDGNNYYLAGGDAKWYTNIQALIKTHDTNIDTRLWSDFFGGDSKPLPVSGIIELEFTSHGTFAGDEVHFTDLTFEVKSQMNDLVTVDGYEEKRENADGLNIVNKYDNELFICHSPNISNIGAIFGNASLPTTIQTFRYKNEETKVTFLQYMAKAYWRAFHRNFIRVEGALYNLYQNNRLLSLLETVKFDFYNNKIFMLTTLNMDIRNETAEFTCIEVTDPDLLDPKLEEANIEIPIDVSAPSVNSFRYLNVKAKDVNDPLKEPKFPIDHRSGIFGYLQSINRTRRMRRYNNYQ